MQRFLGLMALLTVTLSVSLSASQFNASDDVANATMNFTSLEQMQDAGLASPLLAMNMLSDAVICPNDVRLQKVEARSETFECCNQDARFKAAVATTKDVVFKIAELCREDGCDCSAIARICITYERVSDGKCVAIVTAWYTCCCCITSAADISDCKIDEEVCSDSGVEKISKRSRYKCCDVESRWEAILSTMEAAFSDADYKCSILDCLGDLYVRGFQIDFYPSPDVDGVCIAESTIFYSCCCVCE